MNEAERFQIARGNLIEALTIFQIRVNESDRDLEDELEEAISEVEMGNCIVTIKVRDYSI